MILGHCLPLLVALATQHTAQGQGNGRLQLQTIANGADVLFVLDGSQRVTSQQWTYLQNWLQQMVEYWNIGPQGVQVGFYTYGNGAQSQWSLQQAGGYQQAVQEIQGLRASGGTANAGQAIRQAYREGFSAQNGGRSGVPRIIVHVSGGPAADASFFHQAVTDAKQSGVAVYNIGVGAGAGLLPTDLSQVASEPSSRYVMTSHSYQTLDTLTGPLAARVAEELPSGPGASLPPVTNGCLQKADVVFMLDGSSSVGDGNFQRLLNYVKIVSSQLPVSQQGVHVGVMQFASRPSVQFGLGVYTDRASLLKSIDNIQYMGGGSNTADALKALRTEMFSQGMGARPGVPRIAIVVTDGGSSSTSDTVKEADLARQNHISLMAVGVGSGVNRAQLQAIADQSNDALTVDTFDQLPTLTTTLLQKACQVHATAAPLSATVNPNVVDPCQDKLDNCNLYEANMCTQYAQWAQENCNRTCKICNPMIPDIKPRCSDKLETCGQYDLSMCSDDKYKAWATDNCALFCGLCGETTTTTGYYGQCYYKGESYKTGETWEDGCDYQCTCVNGQTGQYKCHNKCPLYSELPAECTLVQIPASCCLKPVCNFSPTIQSSVTSGIGQTPDGMKVCEYQGHKYVQGESWDVGCTLKCTCENAATGKIRCQDFCPTYGALPSNCRLERKLGGCCSTPVCEFNTQSGSFTGTGQTSGNGAVSRPTNPPPCVDKLTNCDQYTDSACEEPFRQWAADNCRAFCGLCGNGQVVPSASDRCAYRGKQYKQSETWRDGCDQECVCEQAVYGYYRCYSLCPTYSNVPSTCTRKPASSDSCCETISCSTATKLVSSATNLFSVGAGNYIQQPNPQSPGQMVPVVSYLTSGGGTSGPNAPVQGYQAPSINGCVYKGQLYVQGQRWDDGCAQVCECTSASMGLYTCSVRCPTYQNLPMGCTLQPDPADPCCRVPRCQAGVNFVPVPVFGKGTVSTGIARPPNPNELMGTTSTILVTQQFPQSANSLPTMPSGVMPTGGIGFCVYKNQTYGQAARWTDGCSYNCLCQDASIGYWVCSDMCLTYPPMPDYCHLETDKDFPCCHKPHCDIPGSKGSITGIGNTHHPAITTMPPMIHTTTTPPRPAMCQYKGQEYSQGQEWYDGCDFKCTCYDAISNLFSCTDRCPTFFGLDETRCTSKPDPRDPSCCTIPVCKPPSTPASGTTQVPTVPGGSFENTNNPNVVGYCDYKGTHYQQGDKWDDGCQYSCECLDETNGRYRCDEQCARFPDLPAACRLLTDFANPCCKKPTCNFNPHAGSISGQAHLHTPSPFITPSPGAKTPICDYKGVQYHQGQTWDDGCSKRCRCEDAQKGLYVCHDRCAKFDSLPSQCVLVVDPTDQCCRIPQCSIPPTSATHSGQGQTPVPFPTPRPGHISGQVNVPTPGPGMTPPPIGYCVYKGQEYAQGDRWEDGCDYDCVCENAAIGKYSCNEKCAKFPNLPPQCRLFKDPANPCCVKPDCSFTPYAGQISGHGHSTQAPPFGHTVSPPILLPGQSTVSPLPGQSHAPNPSHTLIPPPVTPSPSPVCVYRGQVYAEGQSWYDGCDYVCVCEQGSHGTYRCNDRCPSYPNRADTRCTMKPDPADPMCCRLPDCDTPIPTPLGPNGPYVVPTIAPQGVVTGGSVTVRPTPGHPATPGPDGSTVKPPLGTTPAPQPREVCVYKAQSYSQGQKWQDGCDYNCECVDAPNGHYKCTEICPRYPPTQAGCYMVRDVYNPCCETPVCPFPPTQATSTPQPTPGTTQVPPTGPDGHTLRPPVISTPKPRDTCVYNGVPYHTGDTWDDGCDLKCRCEDETSNIYRCDQRCPRYDPTPGCTMMTDPRDSCCLAPFCQPRLPPTAAPNQNPNQVATPSPHQVPIPTAIPGTVVGNSVGKPNTNNPNHENMCAYNSRVYSQGQTWMDGCDKVCVCVDQQTGRYQCKERCPQYLNLPNYCVMVADTSDTCCEKPVCTNPRTPAPGLASTVSPPVGVTQAPNPHTRPTPGPGHTLTPYPGVTLSPNPMNTPRPLPRNVCTYKNAVYMQGQQWYDGCDKACVCEDGTTGYYRCSDRCKTYDTVPAGCTLVVDPKDPTCCKVPQCAPTPGPLGFPTPPSGQSPTPYTVTNVPGVVTGHAPTPTKGTDGKTPQPRNACVYKGRMYARGQRWQDGCDFNCVCENEITGEYKCSERCSSYPMVPPQCRLNRDPNDFCCQIMTCDPHQSTPNPFLTASPQPHVTAKPNLGPTTAPPSPNPNQPPTPRPIPVGLTTPAPNPNQPITPNPGTSRPPLNPRTFCVYNGVAYSQGQTWTEGCAKTCRCDDADKNYYTCFDRCPKYNNLDPKCTLTLDPNDRCCQMPVCPEIHTTAPTFLPGQTPGLGGVTPAPTPTSFAVPHKVPTGQITGNKPNTNPNSKEGMCVYKGSTYKQGQKWDDGCDFNCTCIDETTGRYICDEKCDRYTNVPPYCVLVKDPANQCCMKSLCTPPVTQAPHPQGTKTPPGTATLVPPVATGCVMNGRTYTQGQQWYDDCKQICVCEDGTTGFYRCRQRCPDYPGSDPTCLVVPDPSDPACCTIPQCPNPQNPQVPTGHKGTITGNGQPPTPKPRVTPVPGHPVTPPVGQTLSPFPGTTKAPTPRAVCVYKGQDYKTGQRWRDGCDYECACVDGMTGQYKCTDRCNKYPPLVAPGCRMERDPNDPCCEVPNCSPTAAPSLNPNQTPGPGTPGQNPTPNPNQVPNTAVCVYQGVPYRQGQTWTDGCDKVCRCEDGMTGRINCDDRCSKYPNTQAGCRMVTDPQDSCCQIPQCQNPNTNNPIKVITGVPGTKEGNSLPPQMPNPLRPQARVCVYRGTDYQQGQQWDDGCSYTCVCEDASTGHYRCTERCARVPNPPPTCHQVPDPADLCCQVLSCPAATQTPPLTQAPPRYTGPPTQAPPRYTGQPTQAPPLTQAPPRYTGPPTQAPPRYTGPPTQAPPLTKSPFPYTGMPTKTPPRYTGPPTVAPPLGYTHAPNPFATQVPQPKPGMCLYKNQYYREKQMWYDGCNAVCTCEDANTGFYRCQERCGDYKNVDNSCIMVADPKDPTCCKMPECPLLPPGGTTPAGPTIIRPPQPTAVITNFPTPGPQMPITQAPPLGPDGHTLTPPLGGTKAPTPRTGCMYKGRTYQENEHWDDGCDYSCVCLSEQTGQYKCSEKCARVPSVPKGCVLIQDPQDACCQVPYCDFGPNPFPHGIPTPKPTQTPVAGSTTPMYIIPGFVTVHGDQRPTTNPFPTSHTGGNSDVCVYQGVMYRQGQQWQVGCDKTCVCDVNGLYTCRERCQSFPNLGPACMLRANPADPCCLVPDCNPNYVTPMPGTGITGSNPNVSPGTGSGFTGSAVTPGPGTGYTGSNPNVSPGHGPGISGTRAPILVPTASPGVFMGQRPPIQGNYPSMTGYSNVCVYKGATYKQGANWEDGCQYRCECIDAIKGTYRCTERCSSLYFLPKGCTMEQDPKDACCRVARCSPDSFPRPVTPPLPQLTGTPPGPATSPSNPPQFITMTSKPGTVFQGTRSPIGSTVSSFTGKPPNKCVYTDARTFGQGETWTDGCAYTCTCENAAQNTYKCNSRCPVYSDLPAYCQLVDDPADRCCQKVSCTPVMGKPLVPVTGTNKPPFAGTMAPGVTNVIPIGTHTMFSGSGLPPGETRPGFFGGRAVCIYKGTIYHKGEKWDDGCDYTCECLNGEPAVYQCTSKCPTYPPVPQYCSMMNVPGQCCPSLHCNIPDAGTYNPRPQLYPKLLPTQAPNAPQKNPQLLIPGGLGPVVGGTHLPGGGYVVTNPNTIGGILDRCVYQDTDGQYRVYLQGETWRVDRCGYDCVCKDSRAGFYQCTPVCPDYGLGNLPPTCKLTTVQGQCCPTLSCTNPDGTVTNPSKNPQLTKVPVFGVITAGYSGFRPGYVPGHSNTIAGHSNVCVYKGVAHQHGEHWDDGCDFTCDCTDASTGLYTCRKKCNSYTALPPICQLTTVANDCCPRVRCQAAATHSPPTTSASILTSASGPCSTPDRLDNCKQYDKAVACVGQYEAWARENCAVTCGFCPDIHPTNPGPCVDMLTNCDQYGASACVGEYEAWARDNCAKTCNLCPCYDKLNNCKQYGSYACGGQYEPWARDNCAQTCGLCPGSGSKPVTQQPGIIPGGSGMVPQGWTLLLKGVGGAPGDMWSLWSSPNTANTRVPAAQQLTSAYVGHYKPQIANDLDTCDFDRIKVAVYNNGMEKAHVTFDGRNTGRDSWFDKRRIIESTFTDINSQQQFLQMAGDPATGHEFFIGQPVSGCTGSGWIMVSTRNTCTSEAGTNPGFYYSSTGTASSFNSGNMQSADVFAILGQGGSCSNGATNPPSITNNTSSACVYKNNVYKQGQWWQDGCQYNCTCEDASRGFYRCTDLCLTYPTLPPLCNLVKPDGECCAKPMGPGCPGTDRSACVYKSQIYQQGQKWNDGCDYTCECVDGGTGRYQCTSMCLDFNLPAACHYDPAPAGKCCKLPVCPSYIQIQYPPGYVPR
ncbi:hypothetical protein V1264_001009 [Littorina saxatilis]|uniref:Uncharacterized protein n=1 Tax=Littorina saxatilis TaxID=31220 RepID=A0AAN9GND0_9CAEN